MFIPYATGATYWANQVDWPGMFINDYSYFHNPAEKTVTFKVKGGSSTY